MKRRPFWHDFYATAVLILLTEYAITAEDPTP